MFIIENVKRFASEGRIAASGNEGELTYKELDERSEALGSFFISETQDKTPVILWGDKEHDMLTGVLAALKTGRPYIMIPNYFPEERTRLVVESCHPSLAINVSDEPFPSICGLKVIEKDELSEIFRKYRGETILPEMWLKPEETACIFYTSGSTGLPKGVVITGKNLKAYVDWWFPISDVGIKYPRLLNFASYSFSASITTIYNGLGMLGATLYPISKKLSTEYALLMDYIIEVNPHYFDCTPSFADVCMNDPRFNGSIVTNMRQFSVGGEPLSSSIALKMIDRFPNSQIINGYGATETTIGTILGEVTREMALKGGPMPIGYASFNSKCLICDEDGKEIPDGEIGELVIISDMISAGYYNDLEKTEAVFFTAKDGTRGYHTHDLAWKKDGLIYYVGRGDNLVKVGGYRVELEDVELHLAQAEPVSQAYVVPVMQGINVRTLAAFIKLKPDWKSGLKTTGIIKQYLRENLYPYMVPQKFLYVDSFPRNANDKIDRKAMIEMCRIEE